MKPSFFELARQALSDTRRGYDMLAEKFEFTEYATPLSWIEASLYQVEQRYPLKKPHSEAADLACGTGRGARVLRQYCDRVSGYDFSEDMLAVASRLSTGISGHSWYQEDLQTVELPARKFQRVTLYGAWGHVLPSFRSHLLKQILHTLAPDGVFVTLTTDEPSWTEKRFWYSSIFDLLMRLRNRLWPGKFHMYYGLNNSRSLTRQFSQAIGTSDRFQITIEKLQQYEELPISLLTIHRQAGVHPSIEGA